MANPRVFYEALDSFLAEKGYDQEKRVEDKEDGHMIRFYLAQIRSTPCAQTGPCVGENVRRLLQLMQGVPDWTDAMATSALKAAGLCK